MAFTEEGRRTQQKWMVEREQVEESHATLPLQPRPPPPRPPPRAQGDAERESGVRGSDGGEKRADRCCVVEETCLDKEDGEQQRKQPQNEPMVPPLHPEPPTTLGSNSRKLATPAGHWSANPLILIMVKSSAVSYTHLTLPTIYSV